MNYYDHLLQPFCSTDELRPKMSVAQEQGQYVYATDGVAAIRIPKSLCKNGYGVHEMDFERVFSLSDRMRNSPADISPTSAKAVLDLLPKKPVYRMIECDKCQGEGEVECPCCHNEVECKECGGEGEIKREKIGEEYDYNTTVDCGGSPLRADEIQRLLTVVESVGTPLQLMTTASEMKAALFNIGEIQVVIMPCKVTPEVKIPIVYPGKK